MKIAVVAPSCTLKPEAAEAVLAIAAARGDAELAIHPQCFLSTGHFAGPDVERLAALREVMADASVDAVWFARGGYGSNRIAEAAARDLPDAARARPISAIQDAGLPAGRVRPRRAVGGAWADGRRTCCARAARRRFIARSTGW